MFITMCNVQDFTVNKTAFSVIYAVQLLQYLRHGSERVGEICFNVLLFIGKPHFQCFRTLLKAWREPIDQPARPGYVITPLHKDTVWEWRRLDVKCSVSRRRAPWKGADDKRFVWGRTKAGESHDYPESGAARASSERLLCLWIRCTPGSLYNSPSTHNCLKYKGLKIVTLFAVHDHTKKEIRKTRQRTPS